MQSGSLGVKKNLVVRVADDVNQFGIIWRHNLQD